MIKKLLLGILLFLTITTPTYAQNCGRWDSRTGTCTVTGGSQCTGARDTCCTTPEGCYYQEHPRISEGSFSEQFFNLNQALLPGASDDLTTIGGLINTIVPYLLIIAGLILFGMIISGGFTIMTATQNPDQAEAGKQRITTAVIGFFILFAAYWITQALEIIFGINILGN